VAQNAGFLAGSTQVNTPEPPSGEQHVAPAGAGPTIGILGQVNPIAGSHGTLVVG
jgi:hypothetical protein